MKTKKYLIAVLAAAMLLCSCGDISDEPAAEEETVSAHEQITDENSADGSEDDIAEPDPQDEPTADSSETEVSEPAESYPSESSSIDDSTEDSTPDDIGTEGTYSNNEFGFTLPLPEGTEYNEVEDTLKPTFDDDEIQFRALMETVSSDSFNMAVQIYETAKTTDDFAKARWEYADRVNNSDSGDEVTILDTSNADIGGKPAQIVTEKLTGTNGTFCTLRAYILISDGQYIYIQGNCFDEDTMNMLRVCAEGLEFNENQN